MTVLARGVLISGAIAAIAMMLTWFPPAPVGVVHVVPPVTLDLDLLDAAVAAPRRDLRGNPIDDALRHYPLSPDRLSPDGLPEYPDNPESRLSSPSA
jgi:hypothetical protein